MASKFRKVIISNIRRYIGNKTIPEVSNLDVIVDSSLTMEEYITSVCKSASSLLINIGPLRRRINQKRLNLIVHACPNSKMTLGILSF